MGSICWLIVVLLFSQLVHGQTLVIKIPLAGSDGDSSPSYYPEALLRLALAKTEFLYGGFSVEHVNTLYSSDRLRAMLVANQGIDVMWSTVTFRREREMRSIGNDIFRGLSSYRRLLVRKAELDEFENIKSIDDLQHYQVGVGTQWSDRDIFAYNNLPLIAGTRLDLLAFMMVAGRFDYLVRGLHEYEYDLSNFSGEQIKFVDNLMLHYCQPVKFFVNKNNYRIIDRLSLGLALVEADGSADALFEHVPALVRARSSLKNFSGRLISLDNPQCAGEGYSR